MILLGLVVRELNMLLGIGKLYLKMGWAGRSPQQEEKCWFIRICVVPLESQQIGRRGHYSWLVSGMRLGNWLWRGRRKMMI